MQRFVKKPYIARSKPAKTPISSAIAPIFLAVPTVSPPVCNIGDYGADAVKVNGVPHKSSCHENAQSCYDSDDTPECLVTHARHLTYGSATKSAAP